MSEIKRPVNVHKAYHAHVYFNQATLDMASQLCQRAGERFPVKVGRIHQKPIGPHTEWSCQIAFGSKVFDDLVPWLDKNRSGLSILVHAMTGDDLQDHTEYAYWLGDPVAINTAVFNDSL